MKKLLLVVALFSVIAIPVKARCFAPKVGFMKTPPPFATGQLKVSDIHEIHYEVSGNPKGKPVFFVHGGPGGGSSPSSRQAFDPKKFMVVLYDQRGCGDSKPLYETKENTTQDLVEDIEKLRLHLGLGKIMIVGGSWGSTLALAYAEAYPQNVSEIVLRGIFLGTKDETEHFYKAGGVEKFFPEVFDKTSEALDPKAKDIDQKLLLKRLTGSDEKAADDMSRLWTFYEIKITSLDIPDAIVDKILTKYSGRGLATLETYYSVHDWFLKEGQLLKNADRIKDIPITMVQGRYDMITPPLAAYRLSKALPNSRLWIVEAAGHTDYDPNIAKKMLEAIKDYEPK